ncbi:glutamate synthase-related protein [Haloplasma contractile]|uniref:Glutamate synthase protein n=1 Tax=Haloplasma contractile SSD-17B TaxID=1033810 RepID=F7PVH5_9MOLU|nr:glutamate synthase-related protein [Haloplasma contractile]ERJ12857.1 glutamate synthase protein [Haloplasma contractile SSD-17B]
MSKNGSIKIVKDGPIISSYIDKMKEANGRVIDSPEDVVALCRCGKSEKRPFCDGTHGKVNFTDEKKEGRVQRKLETYKGETISIHDDRGICSHAGYCTEGLPDVFQMGEDPWIDPNGASKAEIIKTIEKCPSGALSYSIDGEKHDDFSDFKGIELTENRSFIIRGGIPIENDDQPQTLDHYTLCRCGKSKNKPYCNGEHWYENFKDDGKINAVENEEEKSNRFDFNNKVEEIKTLAKTGETINSAMRTLETFPDFKSILFKGSQLKRMPLNSDEQVDIKTVIGKNAKKPLELSMPFYVSHMSFGALSKEAKVTLAKGSSEVNTAMCSGEGGMLPESRDAAKKYIYELGTSKYTHDEDSIRKADAVELKIGQGVKPGLGGHLPACKVTAEIAKVRGINENEDLVDPARFASVDDITDLIEKVEWVRDLSGGVPVGIKLSTGNLEEDLAYALMARPDFITIDCRGGATGSTPKFIKDNVGIPPIFAIRRARKYLDKMNSEVTLCATGGFRDSSDIAKGLALGADAIALATASLISIGCIQARICNTNKCPAGITTQDQSLRKLLDKDKAVKQFINFYNVTAKELKTFSRSNGKNDIHELNVDDLMTTNNEVSLNTDILHV